MTSLELPVYGIKVTLGQPDPAHPGAFLMGTIEGGELTAEKATPEDAYDAAADGLLSMILGHAVAGVDVMAPAYIQGVEAAAESIANTYA